MPSPLVFLPPGLLLYTTAQKVLYGSQRQNELLPGLLTPSAFHNPKISPVMKSLSKFSFVRQRSAVNASLRLFPFERQRALQGQRTRRRRNSVA